MRIKTNPMLEMTLKDIVAINRVWHMCGNLIYVINDTTMTEDACIICADNGEVFATKKEIYAIYDTLETMYRIMTDAPYKDGDKTCENKELAINFID